MVGGLSEVEIALIIEGNGGWKYEGNCGRKCLPTDRCGKQQRRQEDEQRAGGDTATGLKSAANPWGVTAEITR
ncbi:hypothetical protein [Edaphobacter aggregans]|uniref:hypothetical protein n=1 Tax=Edaphobacter aggregans TaxID=570835 RepID=UPI000556CCA2|nr:hypothetical protein [Edaphobacter aggregans]